MRATMPTTTRTTAMTMPTVTDEDNNNNDDDGDNFWSRPKFQIRRKKDFFAFSRT